MKVIFLDIDGVLVSKKSYERFGNYKTFDPDSVKALNRVLKATDARIVISSSWRVKYKYEIKKLAGVFKEQGVAGEIIGYTPVCGNRGLEIREWLNDRREVRSFVIIDDGQDANICVGRFVKTSWKRGMRYEHADKAIEILQRDTATPPE